MMTVFPNYYPHFACKADRCRHNCCIGWEIDIDEDTLAYYDALGGEIGQKLQRSIKRENGCACFVLDQRERCPFLGEDNLCEIILQLGEDALSDICTDHPRFRHFFSDRTELGLGLSCESAAALILSQKEKTLLLCEDDGDGCAPTEEEAAFYRRREEMLALSQQREWPLDRRMQTLLCRFGAPSVSKSNAAWADVYRSLERMDASFDAVIDRIATLSPSDACGASDELIFEKLLVYFLYRHLLPENERASLAFAVHATRLLRALSIKDQLSFEEILDLCRLYSSEIEYSEENTAALLSLFEST